MKRNAIIILFIIILQPNLNAQNFNTYFSKGSLRVDYIHTANNKKEIFSLDTYFHEPYWGGSEVNLIDTFEYGHYKFEVYDSSTSTLIYSRGYSTLCGEWRFTDEAKIYWRSFSESLIMPFPKNTIKIKVFNREKNQSWKLWSELTVNPKNYNIIPQQKNIIKSFKIHNSGEPSKKLDIVLLAEGYTQQEMQKFMKDAERFKNSLLSWSPLNKYKDRINVWAIPTVSEESGTDIPGKGIYKNTLFDSHFYTFGTERYINTINNIAIRNAAANAPYDQIYILVNTDKYGGAGIFNFYSICTADNEQSEFVFNHEFGHAFAGLADEYYTSDVGVEDFYDLKAEPWEPNITTMVNFEKKWKYMLDDKTPIPTPDIEKYKETLGVFEGAGYVEKNVFRPKHNCSMKSIKSNYFCPVCSKAFIDMINFYSK
ncbi:MAG: peptidase M64 [Bacteroidetes bacterium]|nr:MAG: peptidase M64 [Bacteroidota bacterium]